MSVLDVAVTTPDGTCPATLHVPDTPPRPAVVLYPDAGGARKAMAGMADRLAGLGYVTLLPDVYYRYGDWNPFDMATAFADPAERGRLMGMIRSLTPERVVRDAEAFVAFLLGRPEVSGTAVGTTGYCMGGRLSLTVAGHLGERIAAAASFHGGGLAKADSPDSPHLRAAQIRAEVYVAGAQEDASFTADDARLLEDALRTAGVRHTVETYPAKHGFAVPDSPAHDEAAEERHWATLERLFRATLG